MSPSAEALSADAPLPGQLSEAELIDQLRDQVRKGFGLVPFIGSGCSADSGILMGKQFTDYLGYTVWRCLEKGAWDLRRLGWPPLPNQQEIKDARKWALEHFIAIAKECGIVYLPDLTGRIGSFQPPHEAINWALHRPLVPPFLRSPTLNEPELGAARQLLALLPGNAKLRGGIPRPNRSPTSVDAIIERAIRSLHDWRATLAFLSELRVEPTRELTLADPDSAVIDSFNVHITRGRRPSPVHYMLSHLREPARMRVILTTNFDTMIEDAFQMHHRRLDVVPVSIKGSLPHPDLVHSRDTLVKLHGGLTETRADFSLDDEPTLEDRRKFFHYIRGAYPRDSEVGFLPAHVLVAGYSGSDARCVSLLKFVLDSDRNAKVFWICHTQREVQNISQLFQDSAYQGQIFFSVAARFDLLLLELYQRICLHLPPGGDNFPLNHEVPPTAEPLRPVRTTAAERIIKTITTTIAKSGDRPGVFVADGPSGVLPAMREATERLVTDEGLTSVWLELEDCASTAAVAHHLFQAIANKRGLFQLSHALLCPKRFWGADATAAEWKHHIDSLVEHMGITPAQWLVVLYGRNGPGGCTGWQDGDFWKAEEYARFDSFLEAVGRKQFVVLYAPYSPTRQKQDRARKAKLIQMLIKWLPRGTDEKEIGRRVEREFLVPEHAHANSKGVSIRLDDCLEPPRNEASFQNVMDSLLGFEILRSNDEPQATRARLDFFYGVALFRQSRPYSALLAEGILSCPARFNTNADDNDYRRFTELEERLKRLLETPRVFLRKSGGFLWLYRDVRQGIRALVLAAELAQPKANERDGVWPREETISRAHFHIAEWYERAFLVSGHAGTLVEAAFHFYRSAVNARNYSAASLAPALDGLGDRGAHRWLVAVCQLIRVLRVGRSSVRFWMEHAHRLDWFGPNAVDRVCEELAKTAETVKPTSAVARNHLDSLPTVAGAPEAQALDAAWSALSSRLFEMLRAELSLLGSKQQPAARILSPLTLYGPELGTRDIPDTFLAKVTSAIGVERPDWWNDPSIGVSSALVSIDLLEKLSKNVELEPKQVFRIWRQDKFQAFLRQPIRASFWMQELIESAYISLRRATLDERVIALRAQLDPDTSASADHRVHLGKRWVSVCVLASAALEVSSWNPPGHDEFVMRIRSKAEAIYGLALAHLHRFYEAHRRLNHAHALALRSGGSGLHVMLGIIELRRAETYLIESEVVRAMHELAASKGEENFTKAERGLAAQLGVGQKQEMRQAALRDDAWCAAERAEGLLAGRTHGSGWWVRLRTLQLWALSLDAKDTKTRGLTERVRHEPSAVADRLFSEGRAAFPDDWHNRLRLLDYYLHAGAAMNRVSAIRPAVERTIKDTASWEAELLDPRTTAYLGLLRQRFAQLVEHSGPVRASATRP